MSQAQAQHLLAEPKVVFKDASKRMGNSERPKKAYTQGGTIAVSDQADTILKAFNTWAYKREQPSCLDRLRDVAVHAVTKKEPVPFVLYWGKGPRAEIARPDLACLDYLASMANRIRAAYEAGASIRLILTDTHARLNGHSDTAINNYFSDVVDAAAARGFETVRLSALVAAAAGVIKAEPNTAPCGAVLDSLVACAAKWYRGEGSTEGGAVEYYRMNMVEKRAVEFSYPEAVFVTFNNAEFRELFPATMPIFYMYSLKRGVGIKPWFMPADDSHLNSSLTPPPGLIAVQGQ